jgi:hypothetical protein
LIKIQAKITQVIYLKKNPLTNKIENKKKEEVKKKEIKVKEKKEVKKTEIISKKSLFVFLKKSLLFINQPIRQQINLQFKSKRF